MSRAPLRRRGLRTTTALATSLVLATTLAVTPTAALPGSVTTSTDDASSPLLGIVPDRSSSEAAIDTDTQPHGETRLDATDTIQEGIATTAREPRVLSRSARLWLSTVDGVGWSIPDQQYVSVFDVKQDVPGKKITITAEYGATPTAGLNTFIDIYLGKWTSDERCVSDGHARIAALGHGAANDALFVRAGSTTSIGSATRSLSGAVLTVTATGNGAGVDSYECAFGYLDAVVSDAELEPLRRAWAEDLEAKMEKAPKFNFYSLDLHAAYPGKWSKVRISVRNDGDITAKNVKLRLSGSKLKFKKKTVKVGTIKAGKSKAVNVSVKLSGKKTRTLKAKATASGKWTATAKTKVGYRPKPKKVKSLSGRSYWAHTTGTGSQNTWQVHGLTFVNKKWVYVGVPEAGTPKCSSKVKKCKRYSYSAKKGTLKIGKLRAKVSSEGIKVTKVAKKGDPKVMFTPLKSVKKGSKLSAKLKYTDNSGPCPPSCRSWWDTMTLKKNGTFTRTPGSISTFGFMPFQTFISTSGPTKKGTYKVLSKNRIRFTWKDPETGKTKKETRTIGVDQNALGKHNPKYGLLIGDDPYRP